jgi:hypothetical protein
MNIAFTPVIYEHAARFVRRTPWEVPRDADLMFAAHRTAYLVYHQQVIAVAIDTSDVCCNFETDQAAFVERVSRTHAHVNIRVNLDPGAVACNDPDRIYRGIDRVLEIVGLCTNCVMGTSALPLQTPPENIRLIREYLAR